MSRLPQLKIKTFLSQLSAKTPTPGGGGVVALSAASAVSLMIMVSRYSLDRAPTRTVRSRLEKVEQKLEFFRERLIELLDEDALAYEEIVKTRRAEARIKRQALAGARKIPREIARICEKSVDVCPTLVTFGSPYLVSDVRVAVEQLWAAYQGAKILEEANQ